MGKGVWSLGSGVMSNECWEFFQSISRRGEGWGGKVISVVSSLN